MTYLDILDEIALERYDKVMAGYEPQPRHSKETISDVGSGSNSDIKEKPENSLLIA